MTFRPESPGGDSSAVRMRAGTIGVLTKTVAQSPVIHRILHARIRSKLCNDIVLVGDNFIHVKQVKEDGHLQHVATKSDFNARIRAAKTFSFEADSSDEDLFPKVENEASAAENHPPQCVVLTLDSQDLLFLYLAIGDNGTPRFVQERVLLPTFDYTIFQPGEHLAVDPSSRALAVAAHEREVFIYSTRSRERIKHALQHRQQHWSPVYGQRPLQVDGVIQHMSFLYPPVDNNGSADHDHIILLLIVADQSRTRAVWIDWYLSTDLNQATVHAGQPLDTAQSVPSLLIPLRNANFLVASGSEIKQYKNLLSGSASGHTIHSTSDDPSNPGASPKRPVWANWCRPRRGKFSQSDIEHLYLAREDGRVYLIQVGRESVQTSHAGDFECHVGTAFASLGDSRDLDILAIAGDMSTGRIQSIGAWGPTETSRAEAMGMTLIETIPNWASVTDMVVSTLPGKSQRTRDGVFFTSGRQPHGKITEMRQGLEARLSLFFNLEELKSVTDIWALPLTAVGHILIVLSSPNGTLLLDIPADGEIEDISKIDDASIALDSTHRTLAMAMTEDAKFVQITDATICVSPGLSANLEDCARLERRDDDSIIAATIDTSEDIAITAERSGNSSTGYALVCYTLHTGEEDVSGQEQVQIKSTLNLRSEPLSLALVSQSSRTAVLVATDDGQLGIIGVSNNGTFRELTWKRITASPGSPALCDNIAILQNDASKFQALAVCGLRDGTLYNVVIDLLNGEFFGVDRTVNFSQSTVKLTQPPDSRSTAYAMSGLDTCLISWNGSNVSSLTIQNIWISDKGRPELAQGSIVACTHLPPAHLLSSAELAGSLVMISGDEFRIASLDRTPTNIPRQIAVEGTPSRLIYAEQQRCLVCASMKYGVRSFPSPLPHGKPEERRQVWPVVDFVPSRGSESSFTHSLQPGERIYSLLEWSFKMGEDKTYSFILAGGYYTRSDGSKRGKITFLQPVNKNWEIVDVKEGRSINFPLPVYALALIGSMIFVVCTGTRVLAYGFTPDRKWVQVCTPFTLASPGVHVTVESDIIYVSTKADSLVTLELVEQVDPAQWNAESDEYLYQLVPHTMAPRAESLLSHLVPELPNFPQEDSVSINTTKHGQIFGLKHQAAAPDTISNNPQPSELLFMAQLPRSLTCLRQCNIRPPWRARPSSPNFLFANALGCASDGTLVGVALLSTPMWRSLNWLERLCDWSAELTPHQPRQTAVEERVLPIGFLAQEEAVMRTRVRRSPENHVDADVLGRMLEKEDGVGMLRRCMREVAARREDAVGEWMKRHLEEELGLLERVVEQVRAMLGSWL